MNVLQSILDVVMHIFFNAWLHKHIIHPTEVDLIEAQLGRLPSQLVRIFAYLDISIIICVCSLRFYHTPMYWLNGHNAIKLNIALENKTIWDLAVMNKTVLDLSVRARSTRVIDR